MNVVGVYVVGLYEVRLNVVGLFFYSRTLSSVAASVKWNSSNRDLSNAKNDRLPVGKKVAK